jgi:hypothetical protein
MAWSKQDTSRGRTDIRGYPFWNPSEGDNFRTLKIKAAKNIISLMAELKTMGAGDGAKETATYYKAIAVLKKEGEKYP